VADAGGLDLDQHFALARALELHGGNFQRLAGGNGDGGANVHGRFLVLDLRYVLAGRGPGAFHDCPIVHVQAIKARR